MGSSDDWHHERVERELLLDEALENKVMTQELRRVIVRLRRKGAIGDGRAITHDETRFCERVMRLFPQEYHEIEVEIGEWKKDYVNPFR